MAVASRWLGRRVLLVVPVLALTYGVAWAVQGTAPFLASAQACPEPSPSPSASGSGAPASVTPEPAGTATNGDDRLSLSFGVSPDPPRSGAGVSWGFSLTNVSDGPVTLSFGSGQDGDVVLSQDGQERYRWSAGRAFTQALRTIDLAPSETHHFALDDTLTVDPGTYELIATVVSDPAPRAAQRTVTVDGSAGSTSTSPSPTQPPSSSPSDPAGTMSPSPSASATTSDTPSPTPGSTPSSAPLFPLFGPALGGRGDRRPRRRRGRSRGPRLGGSRSTIVALALVAAFVATPIGEVQAQDSGSGGKNVVLVINDTDGVLEDRAGLLQGRASGPTAIPENLASARSTCTDCRTVAVALQAVLVISDPDVASPRNAAVAVNAGCTRCETFAYAWQYVVSTSGPVRITTEGQGQIANLRAEASSLAASDLSFPELVDALDGVAADFRAVIDQQVERVGGRGLAERALDVEDAAC